MYLAIKEISKEKGRFLMIILITSLLAYLVYFLSSLAFGLATLNKTAIDNLDTNGFIMNKNANENIYSSSIDLDLIENLELDKKNAINLTTGHLFIETDDETLLDGVFLGYDLSNEKIEPILVEGRSIENKDEVVVSQTFEELSLGDKITLTSNNRIFEVVGKTEDANYNTLPVIYFDREIVSTEMLMYQSDEADMTTSGTPNMPKRVSAVLVYDEVNTEKLNDNHLELIDIDDFINNIPGYTAQILTFGLMIGALSIIASIVIGIFMYILTMQKKSIFAVLKIQGFKDSMIAKSVLYQTFILVVLGFGLGYLASLLTIWLLPSSVPVALYTPLNIVVTISSIVFALIGTLFSARSILKIDPLEAL